MHLDSLSPHTYVFARTYTLYIHSHKSYFLKVKHYLPLFQYLAQLLNLLIFRDKQASLIINVFSFPIIKLSPAALHPWIYLYNLSGD